MKKNKTINDICIVYANNWEALYVNGDCILQKRRITTRDIMLAIDMHFVGIDEKWLYKRGQFPGRYKDIPLRRLR